MTALSIRNMRITMREQEQQRAEDDARRYAALSAEERAEPEHYWHIERRKKRGGWKFYKPFYGTKREVARFWVKCFKGNKEFRLHHMLEYGKEVKI
jgi:hypothetical protein